MRKISQFIKQLKKLVEEPLNKNFIIWDEKNCTLLIRKPEEFCIKILPFYYKHCNFSSFIRQLNLYGFRKVDPNLWVFQHESLKTSLFSNLSEIQRKKKKMEFSTNPEEYPGLQNQINDNKLLTQRIFLFLSRILDLSMEQYEATKKLLKTVKLLSSTIYSLNLKIGTKKNGKTRFNLENQNFKKK